MRKKKLVWMCLAVQIFLSVAAFGLSSMNSVYAQESPTLEVIDPTDLDSKFVGEPTGSILIGTTFDVDIRIRDLAAELNLSGWEVKLSFNTTWLTAVGYKNGTFFDPFIGSDGHFPICNINNTKGVIHMADMFLGNHTEPYGSGVLMTITFNASAYYTAPPGTPPKIVPLDLYNTTLADSSFNPPILPGPISHSVTDGEYEVPYQDNNPPTIDVPSRIPAGDVLPDEDVKVLVNVTDAESGVKNATLSYTLNNGTSWTDVLMTYNATSSLYEATIPGQPAETWVKFKIIAYDNAGNNATRDGTEPYCVYKVIPEFPAASITILFMVATLAVALLGKTTWSRKQKSSLLPSRK